MYCECSAVVAESQKNPAADRSGFRKISGRVILDGRPVRLFSLVYKRPGSVDFRSIESADGSFSVEAPSDIRELYIAGTEFSRALLTINRSSGDIILNDVVVTKGELIEGRVTDEHGQPVDGAEITILQYPERIFGVAGRAYGNYQTIAHADGSFRFSGVFRAGSRDAVIYALASTNEASSRYQFLKYSGPVLLVVHPLGSLRGQITGLTDSVQYSAILIPLRPPEPLRYGVVSTVVRDGKFSFSAIPAIDYKLLMFRNSTLVHAQRITLPANTTSDVDIHLGDE